MSDIFVRLWVEEMGEKRSGAVAGGDLASGRTLLRMRLTRISTQRCWLMPYFGRIGAASPHRAGIGIRDPARGAAAPPRPAPSSAAPAFPTRAESSELLKNRSVSQNWIRVRAEKLTSTCTGKCLTDPESRILKINTRENTLDSFGLLLRSKGKR